LKNTKVKITMEQTFPNGERDCVKTEAVAQVEFKEDELRIIYDNGNEMFFKVGKTHPYPCLVDGYEFSLYITTDKLLQVGNQIDIEYRVAADLNNDIVSNNKLKMECEVL